MLGSSISQKLTGQVLLVDDDLTKHVQVKSHLSHLGLNCDVATNGEDAVSLIKSKSYDLILMDIYMPGMDGFTTIDLVRQWEKESGCARNNIVVSSAIESEELQQSISRHGVDVDGAITKPFHFDQLCQTVRHFLKM